ncbi:MAG: hypothetical protein GX119_05515, partial [Syntrophomonadaceae bacterium]|nr:hypothetical protein [Syntrophomonadaceae bacterium]
MYKNKRLSFIVAIMMVLAIFCAVPSAIAASQFSDVSGHWAEVQIQCVVDQGVANGYPDQTFQPANAITRAEFITMANRAFAYTATTDINYSDVDASDWYATEIAKAKAAGYIAGYEDGTMRPNADISRQEVAKIMATILKLDINNGVIEYFTDAASIPAWSKDYISAMVKAAYMNGYPDGSFQPAKSINRAEAAVIFCRALNIQNFTQTLLDKAGTYGPENGTRTSQSDIAITADDVTLQNVMIEGDLLIDAGDGDVYLKNVTVTGITTIKSAGSVTLDHCVLNNMIVNDPDGEVDIILLNDSQVRTMQFDSAANVTGSGIESAIINVAGVTIDTPPASTTVKRGLSAIVDGRTVYGPGGSTGGGGGGGSTVITPVLSNVTLGDGTNTIDPVIAGNTLTFSVVPGTAYTTGTATLNVNVSYNISSGSYSIDGTATTAENLLASALALLDAQGGTSGDGVLGSTLIANSPVTITLTSALDARQVSTYTIEFVAGAAVAPTLSNVTVGGISPTISDNTLTFAIAPATAYNAGTATLSADASYQIQGGTYNVTGDALAADNLMDAALALLDTSGGTSVDGVLGSTLIANSPVIITLTAAADASKVSTYTIEFVSNAVAPTLSDVTVGDISPTISGNTFTFDVVSATAYSTGTATLSGDVSYRIQGG